MRRRALLIAAGAVVVAGSACWLVAGRPTELLDSFAECSNQGYPIADTDPPVCSDGENTILGPSHSPEASAAPLTTQTFELLVDGDSGGHYARSQQLIATPAAWTSYWRAVHASLPALPPLLPVDFHSSNVIALSEGPQLTNGYSLKITNIASSAAGTVVDYTETIPTITCPAQNTPTNRYFIVRTAVLPQPVTFRASKVDRHCGP